MKKRLDSRMRRKWDALIEAEGKAVGLTDCRPFLERKLVNDIFYEGLCKGCPCIVKCSSRAPESIVNEYTLAKRLYETDPVHFPAAYACHPGPWAFVATEKIAGGVLAILDSLYRANVIHRDILPSNFLIAPNGHLKLIDFQFAVDMNNPRIDPWLKRHPTYHFAVFAAVLMRDHAWWDDAGFAGMLLPSMWRRVQSRMGRLRFEVPLSSSDRFRLGLFSLGLRIQRVFCSKGSSRRQAIDRRLERFGFK